MSLTDIPELWNQIRRNSSSKEERNRQIELQRKKLNREEFLYLRYFPYRNTQYLESIIDIFAKINHRKTDEFVHSVAKKGYIEPLSIYYLLLPYTNKKQIRAIALDMLDLAIKQDNRDAVKEKVSNYANGDLVDSNLCIVLKLMESINFEGFDDADIEAVREGCREETLIGNI